MSQMTHSSSYNASVPPLSRQRRSEATRHRVINAAIEAFGMEGFERTSTRALVERAGTNLVAIHYHFGSKEAVYRAAAQHIADTIRDRNRTAVDRAQRALAQPRASRRALIDAVCDLFDDYAALALAGGLPEGWRRFLAREQLEPSGTGAFEAIFKVIQPLFETMFALIGRVIGQAPDRPEVRLLTTMIFGQLSLFRTNRAAALRLMGWERFGPEEVAEIRAVCRKNILRLLEPGGVPAKPSRPGVGRRKLLATRPRARHV
jgi:AcrR family transcriptional regulator